MIDAIGWALLQFVWQGAAAGAATGVVLAMLRRNTAHVRYVVACAGLFFMAVIPLVTCFGAYSRASHKETSTSALPEAALTIEATSVTTNANVAKGTARLPWLTRSDIEAWLPAAVAVWLSGVMILSLKAFAGWVLVQRLRRCASLSSCDVRNAVDELALKLRISRSVRVLESALVQVPTVIGSLRPLILIPISGLTGLTAEQIHGILAHELAHIRRHDYLVNVVQTAVETLLFYHPAVWLISRRIRIERENCCDDLAVAVCGDRHVYASALADLEGLRSEAALAMEATGGSLLVRVRRVLGLPARDDRRDTVWTTVFAATVLLILVLSNGSVSATLQSEVQTNEASARGFEVRYRGDDSDHQRRIYFQSLLEQTRPTVEVFAPVIVQAKQEISSDLELTELLSVIPSQAIEDSRARSIYLDAAATIGSNYETRRLLTHLSSVSNDTSVLTDILSFAKRMDSDYELRELLIAVAQSGKLNAGTSTSFFETADSMRSSYERRQLLSAVARMDLPQDLMVETLRSAERIESDHEKAELLLNIRQLRSGDPQFENQMMAVANQISSKHERSRVLSALR